MLLSTLAVAALRLPAELATPPHAAAGRRAFVTRGLLSAATSALSPYAAHAADVTAYKKSVLTSVKPAPARFQRGARALDFRG